MPTLEELLRYKYGEQQTPQDIIEKLDAQNLANNQNTEAVIPPPQNQKKGPQFKGPGLFPNLFSQERREENKALRQEFYPQVKENFEQGNVKAGYEAFVQLPFKDQMLMYMTPGLGNIIDAYEMKYFGELSSKDMAEKYKSGEWDPKDTLSQDMSSVAMGYPFQQSYGPPGNRYEAMSTLAGASFPVGAGELPSLLKGAALFAGRKAGIFPTPLLPHKAKEVKDQVIDATTTGKKDVPTGGGGTGGGGGGDNTPPPTAGSMRFDVEERGEAMYSEQYNRGLNHQSPVADTLDTFSDEYEWNQEEMYKKLRGERLAVTTLEKAIEEMSGFDNPNKKYSMHEMLNLAKKHGVEDTPSGVFNQNVVSQIDDFTKTLAETSPNKVANLSEKMTKQELLDLINKNNPRFSETRTTYSNKFTNDFFSTDMPEELSYTYNSPFVPWYHAAPTAKEAIERRLPDLTINSQFGYNSRLAGDPEIEGIANNVFEQSGGHREVGAGFQYFGKAPDEIPKDITLGQLDNNIFHNRSHIYDDFFAENDGSRVIIGSESQSPYTFTKDPEKIIKSGKLNFPGEADMDLAMGDIMSVQPNILQLPGIEGQRIWGLQGTLSNYEDFVYGGMANNVQRDFDSFVKELEPIFNPKSSINQFIEMSPEAAADFMDTVTPYGEQSLTNVYEGRFSEMPKPKFAEMWQNYFGDAYKNTEKLYNQIGLHGSFDDGIFSGTPNAAIDMSSETTREKVARQFSDYVLKDNEIITELRTSLRRELQSHKKLAPKGGELIKDIPMVDQWFNTSTKATMQDAVENNATHVLFPSNGKAVARQGGGAADLIPDNVRDYGDFVPGDDRQFGLFFEDFSDEWQLKQNNRGNQYKDLRLKAINQAEKDYGIKLPYEEYTDIAGQEFLKITMTPELREAFTVLRKKRGGAIKKPLMNLKYF